MNDITVIVHLILSTIEIEIVTSLSHIKDERLLSTGNFLWESVGDFPHYWEMFGTTFSSHGK